MKNENKNASVADWVRRIAAAPHLVEEHSRVRVQLAGVLGASECDETWPKPDDRNPRTVDDPTPVYQISWRLKLSSGSQLMTELKIVDAATREVPKVDQLPRETLLRYAELAQALDDFMYREGDWPNPYHMPGGSQLRPQR